MLPRVQRQASSCLPAAAPTAKDQATPPAALVNMLSYADRMRHMTAPELNIEAEQLRQRNGPQAWLQLSLVLAHKQPPELARAQELAVQAQADSSAEGLQLHALARLLAHRYGEQRRTEEQLDRQSRQLAELQRRLEQSHERLEALKAIERSLGRRNPPAPPPPRGSERAPLP